MRKFPVGITALMAVILYLSPTAFAQQYKLRQATSMMGMKSESTIYVKGMRKRTEGGGMMGMGANTITIEQCDRQRNILINDKKKLYFIEPFAKENEEVIDEESKVTPPKPKNAVVQKGGVINMWYNIMDTNERKKMYGFTARHVWTSQKIVPSPDACAMKDSMQVKTDGWYIDLPQFNCPVHYRPARRPNEKRDSTCTDRFITHRRGKGKLGFPLIETTTIILGNRNEIQTSVETLELISTHLDSMLFEIPPGYRQASSQDELQDKMDVNEMMKDAIKNNQDAAAAVENEKKPGMIRIGVFAPTGSDQVQRSDLQRRMVYALTGNKVDAVAVASDEEARKLNCDYTLNSVLTDIKPVSKVGGILKAMKNIDPLAAVSFTVEASLTLKSLSDGSVRSQQSVDGKYEGIVNEAASRALDEGCRKVLKALK